MNSEPPIPVPGPSINGPEMGTPAYYIQGCGGMILAGLLILCGLAALVAVGILIGRGCGQ